MAFSTFILSKHLKISYIISISKLLLICDQYFAPSRNLLKYSHWKTVLLFICILFCRMTEELDKLDDDYTAKKVSYDNLPTFKRDMKERYDQVQKYSSCRCGTFYANIYFRFFLENGDR